MAKLLCFVAVLLVASAILAEAHTAPATPPTGSKSGSKSTAAPVPAPAPSVRGLIKKSATFSLKCIIHNLADRSLTFKLVIQRKDAAKAVVAKAKQWTAIGPVTVGCKVPVVQLYVTVKTNKGVVVTKSFPVKLAAFLKNIVPKSSKALVVTASEVKSLLGGKKLVIKVGRKVELSVKL
ncbi:hypothetical protein M758_3G051900 [Ceratodon purpureus]|uniref:Uncharacterized protein n=1 Tax=Ceratodon purpureus TaxID=3225 RepID=A0A8T0IF71_CERPU|nr:hypothetical protein KC19_3G053900 [Ceratodon purpureus]KAG0621834.1 hypothetical protein M758_3G051900 [Ceratodon purpureus]